MVIVLSIVMNNLKHRIINFISLNTLTIFAVHLPILFIMLEVLGHFVKSEPYAGLHSHSYSGFITLAVLSIYAVPVLIVNKYGSFMLGKRKTPSFARAS